MIITIDLTEEEIFEIIHESNLSVNIKLKVANAAIDEKIKKHNESCNQERDESLDVGWYDDIPRINTGLGFSYGRTIA